MIAAPDERFRRGEGCYSKDINFSEKSKKKEMTGQKILFRKKRENCLNHKLSIRHFFFFFTKEKEELLGKK